MTGFQSYKKCKRKKKEKEKKVATILFISKSMLFLSLHLIS